MGFGPTLAAEKLTAEKLPVSDETLRNWLLEASLWERKRRRQKHRQRRERRECFRELTQADGSEHDWLEGRGLHGSAEAPSSTAFVNGTGGDPEPPGEAEDRQ
jgi:hypothetical protein